MSCSRLYNEYAQKTRVFLTVWVHSCGHSGIKTKGCIVKCCDLRFKLGRTTGSAVIGRIGVQKLQVFLNSGKINVTNKYSIDTLLLQLFASQDTGFSNIVPININLTAYLK